MGVGGTNAGAWRCTISFDSMALKWALSLLFGAPLRAGALAPLMPELDRMFKVLVCMVAGAIAIVSG
jgi:hypothetical protein